MVFDWPYNDETRIADAVMNELLGDPEVVHRIYQIQRNWGGTHHPLTHKILISFFREEGKEVETLWANVMYTIIHEMIHHFEHPDYSEFAESFPGGVESPEWITLVEGVATKLAEIVWANVMALLTETGEEGRTNLENWSETILGPHYVPSTDPQVLQDRVQQLRELARERYEAEAEVNGLVGLVGIENLLAAFFGGQTGKIAGAVPGTTGSMLAPHDTGERPRHPSRSPSPSLST